MPKPKAGHRVQQDARRTRRGLKEKIWALLQSAPGKRFTVRTLMDSVGGTEQYIARYLNELRTQHGLVARKFEYPNPNAGGRFEYWWIGPAGP